MPRSVICSPTHMMNAVPVVSVMIVISRKPQPGWVDDVAELPPPTSWLFRPSRHIAMPKAWNEREHDRAVARVLVDLAPPLLALFAELVDGLVDHAHELQDDRRRDVRHDAEGEDREVLERAAREHVEEAEQAARLLGDDRRMTLRSTPGVVTNTPMR